VDKSVIRRVALAVVLVGGGALGVWLLDDRGDDARTETGPPITTMPPRIPDGLQAVSYHGVEILVPEDWTIGNAHCGTPQGNTVMLPVGAVDLCLVAEPVGLTVVEVRPVEPGSLAGDARSDSERVLAEPGVVVTVRGPDAALREKILDDVRVTPVDSNGCDDRVASMEHPSPSGRPGAAEATVPGEPMSASMCRYEDLWLARSVPPLSGAELRQVVDQLNALPEGVSLPGPEFQFDCTPMPHLCAADERRGFVLRFDYAEGPPVLVHVRIAGTTEIAVANGDRTTKVDSALVLRISQDLGYDGTIPDPRNLR
jgi:hypothetical protein